MIATSLQISGGRFPLFCRFYTCVIYVYIYIYIYPYIYPLHHIFDYHILKTTTSHTKSTKESLESLAFKKHRSIPLLFSSFQLLFSFVSLGSLAYKASAGSFHTATQAAYRIVRQEIPQLDGRYTPSSNQEREHILSLKLR